MYAGPIMGKWNFQKQFTPVEMNLFVSIISRMRDKKDETVVFSFEQLKELSDYKPTANKGPAYT